MVVESVDGWRDCQLVQCRPVAGAELSSTIGVTSEIVTKTVTDL